MPRTTARCCPIATPESTEDVGSSPLEPPPYPSAMLLPWNRERVHAAITWCPSPRQARLAPIRMARGWSTRSADSNARMLHGQAERGRTGGPRREFPEMPTGRARRTKRAGRTRVERPSRYPVSGLVLRWSTIRVPLVCATPCPSCTR